MNIISHYDNFNYLILNVIYKQLNRKKMGANKVISSQMSTILMVVLGFFKLSYGEDVHLEYGILAAESSTAKRNFCVTYAPQFGTLPTEKSKAEFHILEDGSNVDWCYDHADIDPKGKIMLLSKKNCTCTIQVLNIQDRGGKGVFFIYPVGKKIRYDVNQTISELINMTVGLISDVSLQEIHEMGSPVTVKVYSPLSNNFDYSLLVIWIIAMFTIFVGAYWSGNLRYRIYCKETKSLPASEGPVRSLSFSPYEESSLSVNSFAIAAFVMCMALMLVLLYFLYSYLVYFLIALFVMASIVAVYSCLEPLFLQIPSRHCMYKLTCRGESFPVDVRQILLFSFAISVSVFWVINRRDRNSWILQDVLGVAFCIHMLKSIRLPSLKICTVLLVLLFFYDIFFVFITPFFTSKGASIMEEVATGGSSSEMVPMVLKVLHLGYDPFSICYKPPYSILGYGDILIPGLLISYCYGYDLVTNKKKIYFLTTFVAYGIGLLVTYVALFLMDTAQPALLYLVPCTLLPLALLGWCMGDLSKMWAGFKVVQPTDASSCPEVQVTDPVVQVVDEVPALPPFENNASTGSVNTSTESNDTNVESKSLLH